MFNLIVITNPENFINETTIINSLFDEGLQCLHLRKPDFSEVELSNIIEKIEEKNHSKIVIHSHHKLAFSYGLKGIHLNGKFLLEQSPSDLKELIIQAQKCKITVSSSIHSLAEIEIIPKEFDYVFLSPVFNSISKSGYKSPFHPSDLKRIFTESHNSRKLVALGGIKHNNIHEIFAIGFSCAAIMGVLWNSNENAIDIFKNIHYIIEQQNKILEIVI